MRKSTDTDSDDTRSHSRLPFEAPAADDGVPRRLLSAFEVAELVGCHEESVRRAYLCGQLRRQRFGVRSWRFHPSDVEDQAGRADEGVVNTRRGWRGGWTAAPNSREDNLAVRKICKPKGSRGSPRCAHPCWFDVMCRGCGRGGAMPPGRRNPCAVRV